MSWFASAFVRTVLNMPVYDCTAGFICYHRRVLESIDFGWIRMKGYGFQISMKYYAYKLGFRVAEVPIIFVDRTEGTSKMSSGIFGEAFWGVLRLRLSRIPGKSNVMHILIRNATIVNEGSSIRGCVILKGQRIDKIFQGEKPSRTLYGIALTGIWTWMLQERS